MLASKLVKCAAAMIAAAALQVLLGSAVAAQPPAKRTPVKVDPAKQPGPPVRTTPIILPPGTPGILPEPEPGVPGVSAPTYVPRLGISVAPHPAGGLKVVLVDARGAGATRLMVNWPQGGWKPSSLCPGDVIISLGDRPLSAPVDLINGLNRIPLGTTVAITGIDAVTNPDTPFAGRIRP